MGHQRLYVHCTERQHVWHCTLRYISSYMSLLDCDKTISEPLETGNGGLQFCASQYCHLGHTNTLVKLFSIITKSQPFVTKPSSLTVIHLVCNWEGAQLSIFC